jgi:hypothetical protein
MINRRRSEFAARSLVKAERVPIVTSPNPNEYGNVRRNAIIRQVGETVARAARSEQTDTEKSR